MKQQSASATKSIFAKIAVLLGLFVVLSLLLSAAFISRESAHKCTGEDCPVCATIAQCENTIRRIGSGLIPVITAAVAAICALQVLIIRISMAPALTPVSRKVRLNN